VSKLQIFSWKPSDIVVKFRPLFRIVEGATEAGIIVGTEAAKFQKEKGIAGQKGSFGGGPFTPQGIEQELQMFGPGVF
tara:strand:- start:221 stop:454 length:234 start_codon:yes stop_codon:yes gene_type:complete